jgi:hypothetical protein
MTKFLVGDHTITVDEADAVNLLANVNTPVNGLFLVELLGHESVDMYKGGSAGSLKAKIVARSSARKLNASDCYKDDVSTSEAGRHIFTDARETTLHGQISRHSEPNSLESSRSRSFASLGSLSDSM